MKIVMMNQYLSLKIQFVVMLLLVITLGLSGCGQADHEPRVGEYGENLVNSVVLTQSEISELNKAVISQPKDTFKRPSIRIGFQGDHTKNPYRFVIVVKGTAMQEGKVELKWIGGIQSESSNGYHPEVFQGDDKHKYDTNEPLLLVIGSDPFSVSEQNQGIGYGVHAELMAVSNIQFQSVEVQIWQGKGTQYNWTYYLKFLLILMVVVFGIYRLISR